MYIEIPTFSFVALSKAGIYHRFEAYYHHMGTYQSVAHYNPHRNRNAIQVEMFYISKTAFKLASLH